MCTLLETITFIATSGDHLLKCSVCKLFRSQNLEKKSEIKVQPWTGILEFYLLMGRLLNMRFELPNEVALFKTISEIDVLQILKIRKA